MYSLNAPRRDGELLANKRRAEAAVVFERRARRQRAFRTKDLKKALEIEFQHTLTVGLTVDRPKRKKIALYVNDIAGNDAAGAQTRNQFAERQFFHRRRNLGLLPGGHKRDQAADLVEFRIVGVIIGDRLADPAR